jgi:hypothetical protein
MTDNAVKWKITSHQGYLASLFILVILLIMVYFSISTKYYILTFGFTAIITWYLISVKSLNTIIGYDERIQVFNFWTKKSIYSLNYNNIKKIEVRYWSDFPGRTKNISFYTSNNQVKKARILGIYMIDFNKFFMDKKIPVFIELNNKFIRYSQDKIEK